MADLEALIRVRRHAVEQKQKFLAELYKQADELEGQKETMLTTLAEERKKVDEMGVEALGYFGHYSEAVRGRVEDIAELKKVEITQERREAEEEKELKKKESDIMDEVALEGYRRRTEEE